MALTPILAFGAAPDSTTGASLWPPGRTEVIHRDLGAGRFRFTMHIRHPQFGELFHHDGVFAPQGDCP
jgi:hypothetical protein